MHHTSLLKLSQVASSSSPMLELISRLHPVAVHFPIALIVTAAGAEWWKTLRRRERLSGTGLACCTVAAIGGLVAAASGWLNAETQSHAASLADDINLHRWIGLCGALLATLAASTGHWSVRRESIVGSRWYLLLLTAACLAIGGAGHLGGSLVYGDDYLLSPLRALGLPVPAKRVSEAAAPTPNNAPAAASTATLPKRLAPAGTLLTINYQATVRPIFEAHCFQCHGPAKRQGRLRLDTLADAFTGEERFWPIHPGKPEESELIARVKLGTDADDRMPPEGAPLTGDQVAAIAAWIAEGAWEGVEGAEGAAKPRASHTASTPSVPWTAEETKAIESLRSRFGARVERLFAGGDVIEIDLSTGSLKADASHACEALTLAAVLADRTQRLSLSGLALDDQCAEVLSRFTKVTDLTLRETRVGDGSLASLAACTSLRTVSLFGTQVTTAGVETLLRKRPSIERLYAGETKVDVATMSEEAKRRVVR
jgi:uncharacterized membrane protein